MAGASPGRKALVPPVIGDLFICDVLEASPEKLKPITGKQEG